MWMFLFGDLNVLVNKNAEMLNWEYQLTHRKFNKCVHRLNKY